MSESDLEQMAAWRRSCCATTYRDEHEHFCPVHGWAAMSAQPCEFSPDGWCMAHSTGGKVAWCRPGFVDGPWRTKPALAPTAAPVGEGCGEGGEGS